MDPQIPTLNLSGDATPLIASEWSHYVIFGCSIFAILWGGLNAMMVSLQLQVAFAWSKLISTFGVLTKSFLIALGEPSQVRFWQHQAKW